MISLVTHSLTTVNKIKKVFQELQASNKTTSKIESIWFSSNEDEIDFKVFPDGCIDLIFDLNHNNGFISGHMTKFQDLSLVNNTSLLGVRFRVESFAALSPIPLSEFKDKRVDLMDLNWNPDVVQLLNETNNIDHRLSIVEKYICEKLNKNITKGDELISAIAATIRNLKGKIVVKEIAQAYLISIRQLERRFKNYMGLTIKEFTNIIRFIHTSKEISMSKQKSLMQLAFDGGYYDHAHMTNNFMQIAGVNPSSFR